MQSNSQQFITPASKAISSNQQLITSYPTVSNAIPSSKRSTNTSIPPISTTLLPISHTPIPPDYWMSPPVIPSVSRTAREIYQRSLEMGRDSHAFSKIRDCQSISINFLSHFEQFGLSNLGDYSPLQETLDWFKGSFSRESLTVKGGFNAAAILSPLRTDPIQFKHDETPFTCEFRLHNPSIAVRFLGEWLTGYSENYEKYMH
jgi:hypothetical protein